jgi:peptide/nickel transport system substrate-binding protein
VVHLARTIPEVTYKERSELDLKGLDAPVRPVAVGAASTNGQPDFRARLAPFIPKTVPPSLARRRRRRRFVVISAVAAIAVLAAVTIPIVTNRGPSGLASLAANSLGLIDPSSGAITRQLDLGTLIPDEVAAQGNTAWVTSEGDDSVTRVDLPSGARHSIDVKTDPTGVAVGDGAVWVAASGTRTVYRISPQANKVVKSISVGNGPRALAVGNGGVWVVNSLDDTIVKIDPNTDLASPPIPVGGTPVAIAIGAKSIWTADSTTGTVSRVDAGSTPPTVRTITVGNGPDAIAFADGAIWVANSLDGSVSRIDPLTDAATAVPAGVGPAAIASMGGAIWIADQFGPALSRIDPVTRDVLAPINIGNASVGVAAGDGFLWVSTRAIPNNRHRGGTLTIASSTDYGPKFDSLDPDIPASETWSLLWLLYDPLIGYKRVGGIDGSTLVPDLAVSMPTISSDGKTYTFTIQPKVQFSNGSRVSPTDVLHSIQRFLQLESFDAVAPLQGIVGARHCSMDACDLSKGVIANADTVTINLGAPDPEFLYKLAAVLIVPASSSITDAKLKGLPGTGPYMVKSASQSRVELEPNPFFKQWSAAAQPEGFPDHIVWTASAPTSDDAVQAVLTHHADYFGMGGEYPSPTELGKIEDNNAAQAHFSSQHQEFAIFMNTGIPPFNKLAVRQALAYAIDRNELSGLYPQDVEITCQVVMPTFIGYQPYCPYTANFKTASPGTWNGPDKLKAQQLIDESGTKGQSITFVAYKDFAKTSAYIVQVLNGLGYHASLNVISGTGTDRGFGQFWSDVSNSRNRVQITGYWEQVTDPLPSELIQGTFSCSGFKPDKPFVPNTSQYCNSALDNQVHDAIVDELNYPQKSRLLWAKIDSTIVDAAPAIPLFIPQNLDFLSSRVGNYQVNPALGVLFDQLWVN